MDCGPPGSSMGLYRQEYWSGLPYPSPEDFPNLDSILKSRDFASKGPYSQSSGFSSSHVWMWELDNKGGWVPKNLCFRILVLEKTLVWQSKACHSGLWICGSQIKSNVMAEPTSFGTKNPIPLGLSIKSLFRTESFRHSFRYNLIQVWNDVASLDFIFFLPWLCLLPYWLLSQKNSLPLPHFYG